jgi:putative membrane protein
MEFIDMKHLVAAVIYSVFGLIAFGVSFLVLDKLTPADLYQEIVQKQNRALSQVIGSLLIGMSIVIAASILG